MNAAYSAYREIKIAENKKRRMRIVRRQRMMLATVLALFIFIILFFSLTRVIQANSEKGRFKYYTSITVHSGDTLNSIAGEYYSEDYKDVQAYIDEVCSINHIKDDVIYAGENIIVPYYSEIYK